MNKWRTVNRFRKYWIFILVLIGIVMLILGAHISDVIWMNILICAGTTFISAALSLFLFKIDILDMIQNEDLDRFGIRRIYEGRDDVFNGNQIDSKITSWEAFLRKSSDKSIDIVGISMYSFLVTKNVLSVIKELAEKDYTIRVVFADPNSEEVLLQSKEENKEGKLKEHIEWLSSKIIEETSRTNVQVFYAKTMPKAFIVRSGKDMIITPYLLKGPFKEPTFLVRNTGYVDNTFYETYFNYIEQLCSGVSRIK